MITVIADAQQAVNVPLEAGGKIYHMTAVSMGNPHCVLFFEEDVRTLDLEKLGPQFENHSRFLDANLRLIGHSMIIDIFCHAADSISAHFSLRTIGIIHCHLEIRTL